jgi:hypothetical protein
MSGGHFYYRQHALLDIIRQLNVDIEFNDVEYSDSEEYCGHQHPEEVLRCVVSMRDDIKKIYDLVKAYDWYVSKDSDKEEFVKLAKEKYEN